MLWTFDPLQAGNAHFNINHLGALPIEYVPDMYGTHPDNVLFGALPTDRFIARWQLDSPARSPSPMLTVFASRSLPTWLRCDGKETMLRCDGGWRSASA